MKRIFTTVAVFLVVCIIGCGKGTDKDIKEIKPPTNLTITVAGDDSLSLTLSWNASITSGIDKYIIYFNNSSLAETSTTTYTYKPDALGEYKVKAYKNGEVSSPSNIVFTQLVKDSAQGPIHTNSDPQGYGWDSTGNGEVYNIGTTGNRQNPDKIDLILDSTLDLRSPNDFDNAFQHITTIAYNINWVGSGYDTISVAPLRENFVNKKEMVYGGTYVLWIQNKYYVKIQTTGVDSITFKYGFQKIPGFRRLK